MSGSELELLSRAHHLFVGAAPRATFATSTAALGNPEGGLPQQLASQLAGQHVSAARTDAAAEAVVAQAHQDHVQAHELTKRVLDEARADSTASPQTSAALREALRRRVARIRAQRAHVLVAYGRAGRHQAALGALRYRTVPHRGPRRPGWRLSAPTDRAGIAVRTALSRLGCPYVWGATGPDHFDCSGLVQWSYARAGVHLGRTTYDQINDGIPVPRSGVRPGDLVFPQPGHVQLALGHNLVVEAPHAGAAVRIAPLGTDVQIRRPR